ncbi:MAG: nucleotidyltransferase domain-containing protein [Anaerolineales bacterium]|nr:nucleotidyltransferase domain-containing protein [Anaerolineales bacterium]
MNWRTEYARKFAERIVAVENVAAIVVAGSTARGFADEYSDLEIAIFWDVLPDDAGRHRIADSIGGRFLFAYDGPSHEDQLLVDEFQVDLWHIAVSHQEATMDGVLEQYHTDLGSLNAMDTVRCCIPLYGEKLVQRWKARAALYPQPLVEKIVREHLESFRVDYLAVLAHRKNPTGFHHQLSFLQQEAFLILLALNQTYFPTFKWLYETLDRMQRTPVNAGARFRSAYAVPYETAITATRKMLAEILELVEDQLPTLDTAPARRRLGYTRAAHAGPPRP